MRYVVTLFVGFILGVCVVFYESPTPETTVEEPVPIKLEQPYFFLEDVPNDSLVYEACLYYGIKEPKIVMVQSVLETGHYRSEKCLKYNNLFGLYDSHRKEYFKFDHWTESVKAYHDLIQYRYKEGDYYEWLNKIGYAEDPNYTKKLKKIIKRDYTN